MLARLPLRSYEPPAEGGRAKLYAETTSEALWDLDLVVDRVEWSEGIRTLFGHAPEDVATVSQWSALLHPDDVTRVDGSLTAAICSHDVFWQSKYRLRKHDGAYTDVAVRGFIVRDVRGAAVRVVGTVVDVGARQRLEQEVRRAQQLEAYGTLASGVMHDLRNMLAAIEMNATLLGEAPRDAPELIAAILDASRSAEEITNQLLLIGRRDLHERRSFTVEDVVSRVARMCAPMLGTEISLALELRATTPVIGDAGAIEHAILNLVNNARDAMPSGGGTITIATGTERRADPMREADGPLELVRITVRDTGSGISAEDKGRIFEPWFTTKPRGQGTGLGLTTAYATVRRHGGWIEVESELGRGATFAIYVPASG